MTLLDFEEQRAHFDKQFETRKTLVMNENWLPALQMYVLPQIWCPGSVRVGAIGDGGRWVCSPWRAPESCVIYSIGIKEDSSFESQMNVMTKHRCRIYSFDKHAQNEDLFKSFKGIFRQWKLANVTNETKSQWTLLDIAKHFSHDKIDFIKIDVETSEYYSALLNFLKSNFISNGKVCQIFIELYDIGSMWKTLQSEMEKAGFLIFYKESNSFYSFCYEYSYVHKDCLNLYGVSHYIYNKNYE